MKLTFTPSRDNTVRTYCYHCQTEVSDLVPGDRCPECRKHAERTLIIDPAVEWWTGPDMEYWHEAAGIFLANTEGEFLFFERNRYPLGLTVPAGHVDTGERHLTTARRELREETGVRVKPKQLRHIATDDVRGDECRRGADAHRWHTYAAKLPAGASVKIDKKEGVCPVWFTLEQAMRSNITFVTRYVITHHAEAIRRAVQ